MGVAVETLPEDNIIIITIQPPVIMPDDPLNASTETMKFQAAQQNTICRITDFRRVDLSFADMLEGMAADVAIRRSDIINILVGTDPIVKIGAQGYKQTQYGGVDVLLVTTRAEALQQAKRLLKDMTDSETDELEN